MPTLSTFGVAQKIREGLKEGGICRFGDRNGGFLVEVIQPFRPDILLGMVVLSMGGIEADGQAKGLFWLALTEEIDRFGGGCIG